MTASLQNSDFSGAAPFFARYRKVWNRFSVLQLAIIVLATVSPMLIAGAIAAHLIGVISLDTMVEFSLGAGENPGMITFGAMFLASPIQWLTGRSQVRVRKYLGIMFYILALNNAGMFAVEAGAGAMLSAPFLIAGTLALTLATPLFLTSSRLSQRAIGMKRWRLLHKLTYAIAVLLLVHVILVGDVGAGAVLITLGFVGRIPTIRRWLTNRAVKHPKSISDWRQTLPADRAASSDLLCQGFVGSE